MTKRINRTHLKCLRKKKTGKAVGVWLLVLGCRFLVNNACLMEDSQESGLDTLFA